MADMVVVPKLSWLFLHVLAVLGIGSWCFIGVFWMCFEWQNPGVTKTLVSFIFTCIREDWENTWRGDD